jgi:organic hydroperoxide reductase OsmC/OhrA
MHPYPHVYHAAAAAGPAGSVAVASEGLPHLETAAPPEFDGPGGVWSPETLLTAAVADCFVLSFRALARGAHFEWTRLECRVDAVLEKMESGTQFSRFKTHARLTVPPGADFAKARHLLTKSEHVCLVANSLKGSRELEAEVVALPG